MNLEELVKKIEGTFDNDEFDELCFSLNINYQNLTGSTLRSKVRALVRHCARHNRLDELLNACQRMRPRETWVLEESPTPLDMSPEKPPDRISSPLRYFWTVGALFAVVIVVGSVYFFLPERPGQDIPTQTPDIAEKSSTVAPAITEKDNSNSEGTPNGGAIEVSGVNENVSNEVTLTSTFPPDTPTDTVTLPAAPTVIPTSTGTPTPVTPTATPDCLSAPLEEFVFFNSVIVPEFGDPRPVILYDGLLEQCVLSFPDNMELVVRHTEQSRNFVEPINGTIEVIILETTYPEGGGNLSHYFITKGNSEQGKNVYGLRVADNGGFGAILLDEDATSNKVINSGPNKILLNCWQRVAFRWNSGFADIFVDGEKVTNGTPIYSPLPELGLNYSGSPGVRIGQGLFEGKIAGVYFYDYARSDDEISADATNYPLCQP